MEESGYDWTMCAVVFIWVKEVDIENGVCTSKYHIAAHGAMLKFRLIDVVRLVCRRLGLRCRRVVKVNGISCGVDYDVFGR